MTLQDTVRGQAYGARGLSPKQMCFVCSAVYQRYKELENSRPDTRYQCGEEHEAKKAQPMHGVCAESSVIRKHSNDSAGNWGYRTFHSGSYLFGLNTASATSSIPIRDIILLSISSLANGKTPLALIRKHLTLNNY